MREICLDTETTGMAAKEGDRIIEIGCVELGEHGLTDKNFHEYIDPERQMEAEVIRVHKITNEFLVGKPKFADIADKFIEFVQGARLIIHNAQFDIGFLNEELRKLGKPSMEEYSVLDVGSNGSWYFICATNSCKKASLSIPLLLFVAFFAEVSAAVC